MFQYKIVAFVNNVRTEAIISASCNQNARNLFLAQYAGAKVVIHSVTGPLR